jgi:hypothetical protein
VSGPSAVAAPPRSESAGLQDSTGACGSGRKPLSKPVIAKAILNVEAGITRV